MCVVYQIVFVVVVCVCCCWVLWDVRRPKITRKTNSKTYMDAPLCVDQSCVCMRTSSVYAWLVHAHFDEPKLPRNEGLNLLISLYHKTEARKLARPVAYHSLLMQ